MNEVLNRIKGKIGLKATCILETDEERQLVWDALESAERYNWHDLRKDPNDLPKPYEDIIFILLRCDSYVVGWINDDKYFDTEDSPMLIDSETVKAWKYIEPFEGEKNDR